jgi:hypothetical protein
MLNLAAEHLHRLVGLGFPLRTAVVYDDDERPLPDQRERPEESFVIA